MSADHGDLSGRQAAIALASIAALAVLYGRLIHAPCDDAYIFFVYAKNFAQGNGLTFNGTAVWGFTSVSWMGLLSALGVLGAPIPVAGEVLSALSGVLAVWTTYLLGRALDLPRAQALVPSLLLAATGDFAFYSSVGLEQVLFVGLVAACAAATVRLDRDASPGRIAGVAALMAAAILTRPEGALICGLLLLLWAIRGGSLARPVACGTLLVLLLAPVLVAMRAYYGDWLPSTYYAKSNAGFANLPHGLLYLARSVVRYFLVGAVLAAVVVRAVRSTPLHRIREPLSLLAVAAVWMLYVTVQGGDNMVGGRFIIPVLPLVYVALVGLLPQAPPRVLAARAAALCAVLLVSYLADPWVRSHREGWSRSYVIRRDAGLHLREHFPPDTLVALGPAGIIPYYSGLPTIDTLGLNDRHIARFGTKDRSLRFAHQSGDGEYVLDRKPDVILFGGSLSSEPSGTVSEREVWASERFQRNYVRVEWEGIGTAWIRKDARASAKGAREGAS